MPTINIYKKRNYKKNYKKSYNSKLRDTKINTLVEKRIEQISKKEIQKSINTLCYRQMLLMNYEPITNAFTELAPAVSQVDWHGTVVECSNISVQDIEFTISLPPVNDPLVSPDSYPPPVGAGTGAPITDENGRRRGNTIMITGVSADIMAYVDRLADVAILGPQYDNVEIRYGFYLWREDLAVMTTPPFFKPSAQQLMKWRPFDYNKSIDTAIEAETDHAKVRKLAEGKLYLKYSRSFGASKYKKISHRLKVPVPITYLVNDQTGQEAVNWKLYCVVMSEIPPALAILKPHCAVCAKVYYHNKL